MNKSTITNIIALLITAGAYYFSNAILFSVGLFAFSGALTNWLAVHMLFEKVPGLYGSGVIPARFEEFKLGIKQLMMKQFFTQDNLSRFLADKDKNILRVDFAAVIEQFNLEPVYDSLVETIMQSSFGGALAMFGGADALTPMKESFMAKIKTALVGIAQSDAFAESLKQKIDPAQLLDELSENIEHIIDQRLSELTPKIVKDIIQAMIRQHLGWLVVWGGVFGGLVGLAAAYITLPLV